MAPPPTPQRAWRSACPNCGAPVDFASAASASAVCGFCRSTLVRDGEALRRIGTSAELFDDHSPLQIGASGRYQGLPFTLVGRLQYGTDSGPWNEWHALFDPGSDAGTDPPRVGWLSEDNGAYVFAFDAAPPADAPAPATLRAGQALRLDGRAWSVASGVRARLIAAQGELPAPPRLDGEFTVVDLRNTQGDVATLDDSDPQRLHWSVGRAVALSALALSGLREGPAATERTLSSRSLACPSCGAALALTLASTMSVACGQCHAVVDVSQGIGGDLRHYAQNNAGAAGLAPQIPLGSTGRLALGGEVLAWLVVGYQERCTVADRADAGPGDGDDADDEQTFWREYLLYNRSAGFAFLVDAEDGWSWVRPITGVPEQRGDRARWQGADFRQRERYRARVTWVLGEFYWRVRRGEVALVSDFEGTGAFTARRLSREQVGQGSDSEVTWSAGEVLAAQAVAEAFDIAPSARAAMQRDVAPVSGGGTAKGLLLFAAMAIVVLMLARCGGNDCDEVRNTFGADSAEYQQCTRGSGAVGGPRVGGGSYGGYSSGGGGHK